MFTRSEAADRALKTLSSAGRPLAAAELVAAGVDRMTLKRLTEAGRIERVARGIYKSSDPAEDSRALWAAVSIRLPHAVFCLESAAAYHGITQNMGAVLHIAIPKGYKTPSPETTGGVSARFLRWRQSSMEAGIETVTIEGVDVKITDPARTVVDMFRYSSIAPKSGGTNTLVDPETFHDTLSRYVQKEGFEKAGRNLRKVARQLGMWEQIKPHIQMLTLSWEKGPAL